MEKQVLEKHVFRKTVFIMNQYFQVTKIVKSLITCLDFVQACFYIIKLFFCKISKYLWDFLLSQKDQSLIPNFLVLAVLIFQN